MISINYQSFGTTGFNLRLRVYRDGETKYVNVNKLLQGKLSKRHWNQKKQLFIPSAPFSEENNEILVKFKSKYDKRAVNWEGSLYGFINGEEKDGEENKKPLAKDLIDHYINEAKKRRHADGTMKDSYQAYEKLGRRLEEFCTYKRIKWDKLLVSDLTTGFINSLFDWIDNTKGGKGMLYVSTMLHSVINYAEKLGWHSMDSLGTVRWAKKNRSSAHKYRTLTSEQCNKLLGLSDDELPKNPRKALYRDFCVFLLFTGQSPCDAISLKYSDIQKIDGVAHFVFKRRKISEKQVVPCSVPINGVMEKIMQRWKRESRDGYIFPIRNKRKLETQTTNNGDIKHFISRINLWLKKLGVLLECDFPLHLYTFRHTAITNYISKDVPIIYVANMMGTSVDNCEKIYYNNQGDVRSRNKVLKITSF